MFRILLQTMVELIQSIDRNIHANLHDVDTIDFYKNKHKHKNLKALLLGKVGSLN